MKLAVLTAAAAATSAVGSGLGCIDGSGDAIDFWYAFRYHKGWDFGYMAKGVPLQKAPTPMNDNSSALSRTLAQLYDQHDKLSYAMWNDEPPHKSEVLAPRAHAKGIFAFDGSSGFWLTHSLPKFPAPADQGGPDYDTPSDRYGQSYHCITIDQNAVSALMDLFSVDEFVVYDASDNAGLGEAFKSWAMEKKYSEKKTSVVKISSKGGEAFTAFSKAGAWNDALWDSLVAPYFQTDLYTETWQNGAGKMSSNCTSTYKVQNIWYVQFPGHDEWKHTTDHSKWAIGQKGGVFCVGDINRQEPQAERGGGAVCTENKEFITQIQSVIKQVEECNETALKTVFV
eukprot:TRINITY_DN18737_c0_g2_i1.p1 TRINITY_DN18737_c0_g2~~TRINITY_DN18737_c0_g2_i1.p1  ORF type:complete len:341 (-),score=60.28 TRINITY_DN18737_c0_g2_i1:445-1467(-)